MLSLKRLLGIRNSTDRSAMRTIILLFQKDLRIEFRTKESLVVLVGLSVMLSLVAAFGVGGAFLTPVSVQRVFPSLWWMIFLFAATLSLGRSLEHELENGAFEGLFLDRVSPLSIYLSKVLSSFLFSFIVQILTLGLLAGMLEVALWSRFPQLCAVAALVVLGYAALGNILVGLSSTSRLKSLLLPLILFPLLFPLLFCGFQLTSEVLAGKPIGATTWMTFLLVVDFLYLVLGVNLYEYAIRE